MTMVITGLGTVSPAGTGTDAYWAALVEGRTLLTPIPDVGARGYPVRLGGRVPGFDPYEHIEGRYVVRTDAFSWFAMVASDEALRDSGVDVAADPYATGVLICSGSGGNEFGQRELAALWGRGPEFVGPYQSIAWFYAASTGQVSISNGLKGMCGVLTTDEPGMLDALGQSRQALRRGTPAMLVGGSDAALGSPFALATQLGSGVLSEGGDPGTAYAPFTEGACGFVPAEGAAVALVEDAATARARRARVRAVVAGHASTFGGVGAFDPGGEGLLRAAEEAMRRAGVGPEGVDVVFADAVGLPKADADEVAALRRLFPGGVAVTAPKAGFGRAYAGAGALDVAAAVLSLEHQVVPPTPHVPDAPLGLDLVTRVARPARLRSALVLSRGVGGGNSALVLQHPDHV
ncbi:ketosynthase chain-length factor [Nocardiopsis sp. ARC36]